MKGKNYFQNLKKKKKKREVKLNVLFLIIDPACLVQQA